ncbi:hypothetical protein AAE02nite_08200 [Adhaeribacter aerolatus]|uniref:Uncharacterized protein n=1 Tax=Adhaeribacter aerolatus TaxID=670289 RepID=A0A512ATW3_9BACT|nr:hypothetical protein AAE02nite_08200 [Adhaeribacter aerolatus]
MLPDYPQQHITPTPEEKIQPLGSLLLFKGLVIPILLNIFKEKVQKKFIFGCFKYSPEQNPFLNQRYAASLMLPVVFNFA